MKSLPAAAIGPSGLFKEFKSGKPTVLANLSYWAFAKWLLRKMTITVAVTAKAKLRDYTNTGLIHVNKFVEKPSN